MYVVQAGSCAMTRFKGGAESRQLYIDGAVGLQAALQRGHTMYVVESRQLCIDGAVGLQGGQS